MAVSSGLILGDCREILPRIPSSSVQLTLTSPPYEDVRSYGIGFRLKGEDYLRWLIGIFAECARILTSSGLLVYTFKAPVRDGERALTHERLKIRLREELGLIYHDEFIYHRQGRPGKWRGRGRDDFEYVPVLKKSRESPFYLDEIKVECANGACRNRTYRTYSRRSTSGKSLLRRKQVRSPQSQVASRLKDPGNVLYFPSGFGSTTKDKEAFIHPALMPEALADFFIKAFSSPGDIVVDPFSGAGTVPKVARKLGRGCIGIEINPEYHKVALQRVSSPFSGASPEPTV